VITEEEEILKTINKFIDHENGQPLQMNSLFVDSNLDSLGYLIALMNISGEYGIEESEEENIDLENLKVSDLVNRCKLANTST
jgi:acyl carrier protein